MQTKRGDIVNKTVVLYSTGCPSCKTLKLMLDKAGVLYTENNSIDDMLSLGFTQVPILCVDGVNLKYNEAKNWVQENSKGE